MRMYSDLAHWWPLLSPREDFAEQAELLFGLLQTAAGHVDQLLELGSGSGNIASWLPESTKATLVDKSEEMLALSKRQNSRHIHICEDVIHMRLGQRFDAVLMHDAVMYLTEEESVRAALGTARAHVRRDGAVLFVPDLLKENFVDGHTLVGGSDDEDRGARLTEWHWDPNPSDDTFQVEFSLLLKEQGQMTAIHESHTLGIFTRERWETMFHDAGLELIAVDLAPGFPIGVPLLARPIERRTSGFFT